MTELIEGQGYRPMPSIWATLEKLMPSLATVPGDFIEFGVFKGVTFRPLTVAAMAQGRRCHAVDSFRGMAEPTERDGGRYPKGHFNVNGTAGLVKYIGPELLRHVQIWEGFVPDVLDELPDDIQLAFAHLDMDQCAPTAHGLRWVWHRLQAGGIMACHDYAPGKTILAAGAINEWMADAGVEPAGRENSEIWFIKGA